MATCDIIINRPHRHTQPDRRVQQSGASDHHSTDDRIQATRMGSDAAEASCASACTLSSSRAHTPRQGNHANWVYHAAAGTLGTLQQMTATDGMPRGQLRPGRLQTGPLAQTQVVAQSECSGQ